MAKPSALWSKIKAKLKTYTLAAAMFFGGAQAVQAHSPSASDAESPVQRKTFVNNNRLINANGVKLNPQQCQPYDIVNAYLSSGKADITDGRLPIAQANNLGEFLFDINRELPGFIKANAKQFPELKKAADEHGIRSVAFLNAWRTCSQKNPQAFKHAMFETRWNNRYAKIFNDLHQNGGFPLITKENFNTPENFAYSTAVISASGLNLNTVRKIFNNARKAAPNASLTEIAAQAYNERAKMFPKYTKRFNSEKQNCMDIARILNPNSSHTADFMQEYTAMQTNNGHHDDDTQQYINSSLNRVRQTIHNSGASAGQEQPARSAAKRKQPTSEQKTEEFTPQMSLATDPVKLEIKLDKDLKAELDRQINQIAHATYNGVKVDFRSLQPQQIGQIFESQMNPCITDGRRHISQARYLGLYQINLATTMPSFVKQYANKYPKLKEAKDKHGIKSEAFLAAWKEYSRGKQGEEFSDDQFKFLWNSHYRRTFDALAATGNFPKITLENYNRPEYIAYVGAVKSCANQNPRATPGIFKTAYTLAQKQHHTDKPTLQQVVNTSYNVRKARWGFGRRYREESKLCQDCTAFWQTVAKLRDNYTQQQLQRNILAHDKQNKSRHRLAMQSSNFKPKNLKELMDQRKQKNRI